MIENGQKKQENLPLIVGIVKLQVTLPRTTSSNEQLRLLDSIFKTQSFFAPLIMFSAMNLAPTRHPNDLKNGIRVNLGDITLISKNKRKSTAPKGKQ